MRWFRLHADAVDDDKLRLLAFEDRWHFVALLCCKSIGLLDIADDGMKRRRIAVKLGLDLRELDEVARRLAEVGLIEQATMQPLAWDKRQYQSDSSTERVRRHRAKLAVVHDETPTKRYRNVSVTPPDTDTDTESENTKTRAKNGATVCLADLVELGCERQAAADWLAIRKVKRLPLTRTALAKVQAEAGKAGLSLSAAVSMAAAAGWAGFRADWAAAQGPTQEQAQEARRRAQEAETAAIQASIDRAGLAKVSALVAGALRRA